MLIGLETPLTQAESEDTLPLNESSLLQDPEPDNNQITSSTKDVTITQDTPDDSIDKESSSSSTSVILETETPELPTSTSTATTTAEFEINATTTQISPLETVVNDITAPTTTGTTTVSIETGDAVSTVNLVNILNTNFVNSEGNMVLLDMYVADDKTLDLRSGPDTGNCSLINCSQTALTVTVSDNANIDNAVILTANTGDNLLGNASNAIIKTGDAYTNANIINLANTNIVDSRYLLAIINAFSDFGGDIVFPSLNNFMKSVTDTMPVSTSLYNNADIKNDVSVDAGTGNNSTRNVGSSTINSGLAVTNTSVINNINTTLLGGQSIMIMFRVLGSWSGQVFGLPSGAAFVPTDYGYLLELPGFNASSTNSGGGEVKLQGSSTASIHNNVIANSQTGNNEIEDADTSLISTGNAYAGVNIVNIANAHVVGRNWMLALVNVFGDFTGDVSFGRPDLFVGGEAFIDDNARSGDRVTYKYTIMNNGDAGATNIIVSDQISSHISPETGDYDLDQESGRMSWKIESLDPGSSVTLTYSGILTGIHDVTEVQNKISAIARETDNNRNDNTDTVSFYAGSRGYSHSSSKTVAKKETTPEVVATTNIDTLNSLSITRSPENITLNPNNNSAEQTIVLFNDSDKIIPTVTLRDVLKDSTGNTLHNETWELNDVLPHEEITLSYNLTINPATKFGVYSFYPLISSKIGQQQIEKTGSIIYEAVKQPFISTVKPKIIANEVTGLILGQSTSSEPTTNENTYSLIPTASAAELNDYNSTEQTKNLSSNLFKLSAGLIIILLLGLVFMRYKRLL